MPVPQPYSGGAIMTNPSPNTFDTSWHRYADAHARCQTLSGATLGSAQEQERKAISQLAKAAPSISMTLARSSMH